MTTLRPYKNVIIARGGTPSDIMSCLYGREVILREIKHFIQQVRKIKLLYHAITPRC